MARAGRVEIEFAANFARLQQDVGKATSILDGFARTAKASLGALGVGLTVAGFASFVKDTAEAYDKLGKLGQQTGLTAQQVSKFSYIAKMADMDVEQLAKGVKILDKNMFQAAQGGGKAYEAFRTLGISVKTASGQLQGNEEMLGALAERFSKMPDGAMKTALAMQIFGRSGADMIPMLNMGREGLKYFADEAERLKGVLSDEIVQKAEAIQMAFKKFEVVREAAGKQMFAGMADDIIRLTNAWDLLITKTNTWNTVGKVVGFVLKAIAGSFTALAFVAEYSIQVVVNMIDLFKTKWDQMADIVNQSGIKKAFEEAFNIKLNLPQFNEARVSLDVMNGRLGQIKDKWREIARTIDIFGQREVKMPPIPKVPMGAEPVVPVPDKVLKEWDAAQAKLEKMQANMFADLDRYAPGLDEWEKKIVDITKAYASMQAETDAMRRHFAAYPEYVAKIDKIARAIPLVRDEVIALIRAEQALAQARRDTNQAYLQAQHILDLNRYRLTGSEQAASEVANLEAKKKSLQKMLDSMPADSRRNAVGVALKEEIDATQRLIEIIQMRNMVETEGLKGVTAALTAYGTEAENVGKMMQDATTSAIRGMEDALVDFTETGKFSFNDLAKSILSDMQRIIIRTMILGPIIKQLKESMGGTGLGGIFGGGMDLFSLAGGSSGMFFHSGGIVGRGGVPRSVAPGTFIGAPRLHKGLASDEVPAILQKGETVIPKGEGAGAIAIHIHAVDGASFEELVRRNPSVIVGQVEKALRGNQSLRYLIKDTAR